MPVPPHALPLPTQSPNPPISGVLAAASLLLNTPHPPATSLQERGGFTETQLEEMEWMGNGDRGEEEMPQHQSATIAWWRGRQSYLQVGWGDGGG